jgi:segregation and condensation protein B
MPSSAPVEAPVQLLLDGSHAEMGLSSQELASLVEALLLVAPEPPTIGDLAEAAGVAEARLEAVVADLVSRNHRGWIVQRQGSRLYIATAPRFAPYINRFLGLEREGRLSSAALETLAIIAYQQPVTRAGIETVRGVDCAGVLATLHGRGLIEPIGRLQAVGNPFQYGTTIGFLKLFGLNSLADLPPLGMVNGEDGLTLLTDALVAAPTEHGVEDDKVIQIS